MTRAVVFVSAAMVAASLGLFAQDISGGARNSKQSNGSQHAVNVIGCVNTSASGGYSLTDDHGATYALLGSTSALQGHNSQRVEITGEQEPAAKTSNNTSTPTIQVAMTKPVAGNCNSGPTPNAASTSVASRGIAESSGQLPQTSTILPLLGLIGLGSLVAGFFARQ